MSKKNVCIAISEDHPKPRSFIGAHIERLPANIEVLYNGGAPWMYGGNNHPLTLSLTERLYHYVLRQLKNIDNAVDYTQKQAIKTFLQKHSIDCVLAEYGPNGVKLLEPCRDTNIPLVVHFHGYDVYKKSVQKRYDQAYEELFQSAKALIANSEKMKIELMNMGASEEKISCKPCGVDVRKFTKSNPADAPPHFLFVGRFVNKKAPYLALFVLQQVLDEVKEAKLTFIGTGPLKNACKDIAEQLYIRDHVEFLGQKPHSFVAKKMRNVRALFQPYKTPESGDTEGPGCVNLEAGASGLPVVTTNHGGVPEVIDHGETGFVLQEGDVEGMANHLIQLVNNPDLARTLGNNARNRIENHFRLEDSIDKLWTVLKSAITSQS